MTTIFYFSGSGNSLAIARDLAVELDSEARSIAHYLKNPTEIKTDILGIIAPVVCSLDLISLVDGIPQFANGCISCFACAQWCPVSAISIGKLKICEKNKYTNSTVTINELYEFNHK